MPVASIDPSNPDLLIVTFRDTVIARDFDTAIAGTFDAVPHRHMLWDLSSTTALEIPVDEVEKLSRTLASSLRKTPGRELAIVAPTDFLFARTRQLQALVEVKIRRTSVAVFRDHAEAFDWANQAVTAA